MPILSPLSNAVLSLGRPINPGDTSMYTIGKFVKSSNGSDIIGAQEIGLGLNRSEFSEKEVSQVDVIASPTLIEDNGSVALNLYKYDFIKRGVDNDNKSFPASLFDADNEKSYTEDDLVGIVIGTAYMGAVIDLLNNALSEISEETDQLSQKVFSYIKGAIQRMTDQQDAFETTITNQQDLFETNITTQQDDFETEVQNILNAGVNGQILIQLKWTDGTFTTFDLVGGEYLLSGNVISYPGAVTQALPAATTYYELDDAGLIQTNLVAFTSGRFPIGRIVKTGPIYSIENVEKKAVGGEGFKNITNMVYNVAGLLASFDADGESYSMTYDPSGQLLTVDDGDEVTTVTRSVNGDVTGVATT